MTQIIQYIHQLTDTINAIASILSLFSIVLSMRHRNQPQNIDETIKRRREYRDSMFVASTTTLCGVALVNAALSPETVSRASVVTIALLTLMFVIGCLLIWVSMPSKNNT